MGAAGYDTQNAMVLHHMQTIGPLSPLEALNRYGIFRLGARRYDLIKLGYDVRTRIVKHGRKRFAEYFLPLPKGQLDLWGNKFERSSDGMGHRAEGYN